MILLGGWLARGTPGSEGTRFGEGKSTAPGGSNIENNNLLANNIRDNNITK